MSIHIDAVHPVLMSSSVADSARFFERLGFGERFRDDPTHPRYAVVSRDGAELHLQWQDSSQWAHPVDRPTYRFLVEEVDALYAEFQQAGVSVVGTSPWASPGNTPWGTREFHVLDPDGNGLQFYRRITRTARIPE
jgi:catechol 2,3-dioxygenase-like lactoylglutathione lyase family enzyme